MPTETNPFADIRRLAAARDEALRRYTQHLASIQLRNSRWSVLLSHGRLSARSRLLAAAPAGFNGMPHAH
jgi:hypothetical protein